MNRKQAYPQNWQVSPPLRELPLQQWKNLRLQIAAKRRAFPEHSVGQLVDHFTAGWTMKDKDAFTYWMRVQDDQEHNKKSLSSGDDVVMKKVAYDFSGSREDRIRDLKRSLRSRLSSTKKLLIRFRDEDLLGPDAEETLRRLSRILYKLGEEIEALEAPTLMAARINRAVKMIKKAGQTEVAEHLAGSTALLKTAQVTTEQPADTDRVNEKKVLNEIRSKLKMEMSALNYHEHLKNLAKIMSMLDSINRQADSEAVAKVIQKDLEGLNSLSNHLAEIYTTISKLPLEEVVSQLPEVEPEIPRVKPREKGPEVTPLPRTEKKSVDIDLPL